MNRDVAVEFLRSGTIRSVPACERRLKGGVRLRARDRGIRAEGGLQLQSCNTNQCGPFLTDIATHWTAETKADVADQVALGRAGEPHEVVGAALYFAGDSSSCTGANLRLDGGLQ